MLLVIILFIIVLKVIFPYFSISRVFLKAIESVLSFFAIILVIAVLLQIIF